MVIIVVILFLKFLSEERIKSDEQNANMLLFIKEQREENNEATVKAAELIRDAQIESADQNSNTYCKVAEAVTSLASEIRLLKESHIIHHIEVNGKLDRIVKAKETAAKKKAVI